MREMLFRGKPKNKEHFYFFSEAWKEHCKDGFVYGSLIVDKDRYFIAVSAQCSINYCVNNGRVSMIEVIPETVGQFTGLYDSTLWEELTTEEQAYFLYLENGDKHSKEEWNGKPIFEGDIVNFKTTAYHFKKCRIKYQICYARYCAIDNNGYEYPMDKTFEYEVIGNIHDNPDERSDTE